MMMPTEMSHWIKSGMVCYVREKRVKLAGRKSTITVPLEIKEVDPADEVSKEALPPR